MEEDKAKLESIAEKLFYVLLYLKAYPTYDVASLLFNLDRSNCCRWIQILLFVLEQTLQRKLVLPKRQISNVEEFYKLFPEAKDIFIDGTERKVQRPQSDKKRKKLYSGKARTTTRKTVVVTDESRAVKVMVKTKSGRRHDKRLFDKNHLAETIPKQVTIWTDTGFQGIQHKHPNSMMPKKQTKYYKLTKKDKEENKIITSLRMYGEHAVRGFKRYKAAADIYRNRIPNLDDRINLVTGGLWNYHLSFSP